MPQNLRSHDHYGHCNVEPFHHRLLDLDGSPPRAIADAPVPRGGSWGRDGHILFTPIANSPLLRVPAAGGATLEATRLEDGQLGHRWPSYLPDGRRFLFMVWATAASKRGIYLGSVGSSAVRLIQSNRRQGVFAGGRLFFAVGETLRARLFDPERLALDDDVLSLTNQVSWLPETWGQSSFSVSEGGVVAFRSGVPRQRLSWYERAGGRTVLGVPDASMGVMEPSPDQSSVAVTLFDPDTDNESVWLLDLARKTMSRVSSGGWSTATPVWVPDGSSVVYRSDREEGYFVVRKSLRGSGGEEILLQTSNWVALNDCSPDGRFMLYTRPDPQNRLDLQVLPLLDEPQPRPFLATPFGESGAQFSPDGAWVAYESDESGRPEVFIRRFPPTEEKWQVSAQGARWARWREDGAEIFFIDAAGRLMAVAVSLRGKPFIGTPVTLFSTRLSEWALSSAPHAHYFPSANGQRFLVSERSEEGGGSISVLVGGEAAARR